MKQYETASDRTPKRFFAAMIWKQLFLTEGLNSRDKWSIICVYIAIVCQIEF